MYKYVYKIITWCPVVFYDTNEWQSEGERHSEQIPAPQAHLSARLKYQIDMERTWSTTTCVQK